MADPQRLTPHDTTDRHENWRQNMSELTRTYTVEQLEALDLPWSNILARFGEDEHRSYTNWQIVFRDPADNTTWAITKSEPKNEMGEPSWWYTYRSSDEIVARRVEAREVTVTQWFDVEATEVAR